MIATVLHVIHKREKNVRQSGQKKMEEKEEEKNGVMKIKKLEVRNVNKALWERFKAIVVAENGGKMKGVLGGAMDEALTLFIESREGGGAFFSRRDTHTHKEKKVHSKRKIRDKKIIMPEKLIPETSRERRLKEIGRILFTNQTTSIVRGEEEEFLMSRKGIERLIIAQNISESRVISDYIRVMDLKGWIGKRMGRYEIYPSKIGEDLDLEYPEGYIEKLIERKKSEEVEPKE